MTRKKCFTIAMSVLAIGVLIFLDQWTKILMQRMLSDGPIPVIPKVLEFYYVENTGAAFNIMNNQRTIFLIVAAIAVVFCLYALVRIADTDKDAEKREIGSVWIFRIFLILIVSGAVGNAIDRALNGFVVDFIHVLFIEFPVFNVADCYVTVGCILLIVFSIFRKGTLEDIERSLKSRG